jgi:probable F420-dependent oxidoreductase
MKFSLMTFGFPAAHYAAAARAAEAEEFDAIWLAEHLVTPTEFDKVYPYNESGDPGFRGDTPLADVWVTMGHIAGATSRIRLGTGVYVLPLRNPFVAAKAIATAQELSEGRVMLGIGTGWMKEEFDAVGEAFDGRGSRTDEMIEILGKLWTGKPVSHAGRWYSFSEVQMSPALTSLPRIVVGGVSRPALARAARLAGGWYGPSCTLEEAAKHRDEILRLMDAAGRDAAGFEFHARLNDPISEESVSRAASLGFEHLVIPLSASLSTPEAKVERVKFLGQQITEATGRRRTDRTKGETN